MVDEHVSHDLRGDGKEVGAVVQRDAALIDQPQVNLVDEHRGLERVARTLTHHVAPRETAQLVVHERHELVECGLVTRAPVAQELRHVGV